MHSRRQEPGRQICTSEIVSLELEATACRVSTAMTLKVKLGAGEDRKIASDHQRARTVEEIWCRTALPEYLFHRVRRGPHRRDWAEWFGQVDAAGDACWTRQSGQRRHGDSQRYTAQYRRADFRVCTMRDHSLRNRDSPRTSDRSRSRASLTFCRNTGPRGLCRA